MQVEINYSPAVGITDAVSCTEANRSNKLAESQVIKLAWDINLYLVSLKISNLKPKIIGLKWVKLF